MSQRIEKSVVVNRPKPISADKVNSLRVEGLFTRVALILDRARKSVVVSVNSEMLLAYWRIGREILQALQGGIERAQYGSTLIERLSERLTNRYG